MLDYNRLKELMEERGVKQNYVAERINRKPSIFQAWRDGKSKPSKEQLCVVAEILGTTPAYLCGETDEKNPATPKSDGNMNNSSASREELKRLVDRLTDQEVSDYIVKIRQTILGQ